MSTLCTRCGLSDRTEPLYGDTWCARCKAFVSNYVVGTEEQRLDAAWREQQAMQPDDLKEPAPDLTPSEPASAWDADCAFALLWDGQPVRVDWHVHTGILTFRSAVLHATANNVVGVWDFEVDPHGRQGDMRERALARFALEMASRAKEKPRKPRKAKAAAASPPEPAPTPRIAPDATPAGLTPSEQRDHVVHKLLSPNGSALKRWDALLLFAPTDAQVLALARDCLKPNGPGSSSSGCSAKGEDPAWAWETSPVRIWVQESGTEWLGINGPALEGAELAAVCRRLFAREGATL